MKHLDTSSAGFNFHLGCPSENPTKFRPRKTQLSTVCGRQFSRSLLRCVALSSPQNRHAFATPSKKSSSNVRTPDNVYPSRFPAYRHLLRVNRDTPLLTAQNDDQHIVDHASRTHPNCDIQTSTVIVIPNFIHRLSPPFFQQPSPLTWLPGYSGQRPTCGANCHAASAQLAP